MLIENLESRRMLSAAAISVVGGVLSVHGGVSPDIISVTHSGGKVVARKSGLGSHIVRKFAPAQIHQIKINGMGANDAITVNWTTFKGKTNVTGDDGNDGIRVLTNGKAELSGGEGDDTLTGGKQADKINGG